MAQLCVSLNPISGLFTDELVAGILTWTFVFSLFLFSHVFTEQPLQGRKRPALRIRGRSPRPTTGIPEIVPERQELHSLSVNEITSLLLPSLCLSL